MPVYESRMANSPSIQSAQAGQVTVQRGTYELIGAQSEDDTNSFRIVRLPAGHRIVELTLENDDLDSGAAGLVDVGIEDTVQDPSDTSDSVLFFTAQTIQAVGINTVKTQAMQEFPAVDYDRYVTVEIDTASGTGLVAGLAVELVSRPDHASHEGNFS